MGGAAELFGRQAVEVLPQGWDAAGAAATGNCVGAWGIDGKVAPDTVSPQYLLA